MLWLLIKFFSALPLGFAMRVGRACGFVWYHLVRFRRAEALGNVSRSLPAAPAASVVRKCFEHLAMFCVEALRLPSLSAEDALDLVEIEGVEHVESALRSGKGVVALTAHVGPIHVALCALGMRGYPIHAVTKRLSPESVDSHWSRVLVRCGVGRIEVRGSGHDLKSNALLAQEILGKLKSKECVIFLSDQHMTHRLGGIVSTFFGQLASTTAAPLRFARASGATIICVHAHRTDSEGHLRVVFDPPFELEAPHAARADNERHNVERLNRTIEGWIRKDPDNWIWIYRRWKIRIKPWKWEIPPSLQHLVDPKDRRYRGRMRRGRTRPKGTPQSRR